MIGNNSNILFGGKEKMFTGGTRQSEFDNLRFPLVLYRIDVDWHQAHADPNSWHPPQSLLPLPFPRHIGYNLLVRRNSSKTQSINFTYK